ncbi:hypothetical protein F2Q69_00033449 [Brassica cretica]|uniref:V-type proton ATPase proteolipid subunit n=1 Tax=Brassica cretica TaxID=69181 RepID=A0A8S9SF34_BRACR|nr:hypothetical protein F2Q69_00033449 [Brassica cretica]
MYSKEPRWMDLTTDDVEDASRTPKIHSSFFGQGMGAAYGTAESGVGVPSMGVMRPELVMKSIVPVVMAGVLERARYSLVTPHSFISSRLAGIRDDASHQSNSSGSCLDVKNSNGLADLNEPLKWQDSEPVSLSRDMHSHYGETMQMFKDSGCRKTQVKLACQVVYVIVSMFCIFISFL